MDNKTEIIYKLNSYGDILNSNHIAEILKCDKSESQSIIVNTEGLNSKKIIGNTYIVFKNDFKNWLLGKEGELECHNEIVDETHKKHEKIITASLTTHIPKYMKNSGIRTYDEKKAAKIIAKNIECIEKGMTVIETEYKFSNNGKVDILAKDIDGIPCLIEIKGNGEDQRIVFQVLDYSSNIKGKMRVITLAPYYHKRIYDVLKKLNFVEIKTFHIGRGSKLAIESISQ